MRVFGSRANTSQANQLPGYTMNSYGFEAGVFKVIDSEWIVGLMMSGQKGMASMKGMSASDDITSLRLGPFFSWQRDHLHIDGALTLGHHDVSARGRDRLTGEKYKGRFAVNDWSAWLGIGYDIPVTENLTVTPMAEIMYMDARQSVFDLKSQGKERVQVKGGHRHDRAERVGILLDYHVSTLAYETLAYDTTIRAGAGIQQNHFAPYKTAMRHVDGRSEYVERRRARESRVSWYTLGLFSRLDENRSISFDLEGTQGNKSRSYGASATFEYKFR
ncbi:autotransporter domain-containing protein [Parendozoicomonas haliclonae]